VDDLLTISRPEMRARGPEIVPAVIVAIVVGILLVVAALSLHTPNTVSLTVDNPGDWRAEVLVRPADSTSWTGAGAVARTSSLVFQELPDQGSEWVVRFKYADHAEDVSVSRDQLAGEGWSIEVPASFGAQLEDSGIAPTTGSTSGA
jgi:hypothetical protein